MKNCLLYFLPYPEKSNTKKNTILKKDVVHEKDARKTFKIKVTSIQWLISKRRLNFRFVNYI